MEKRKMIIAKIILVLFSIVFLFSLYHIITWYLDNKATSDLINQLQDASDLHDAKMSTTTEILDRTRYHDVPLLSVDFTNLLLENNEVKGWIQIPGTNINYPFVQHSNNSYYLNHSFDKRYNDAGWLFLDSRSSLDPLDMNTIIYAHGRVDGTMFGSLKNVLTTEWKSREEYYIRVSTLNYNYLFEIFSVYHIPTTKDYLTTNFSDKGQYEEFLKMIQGRSLIRFDTMVNSSHKILTLSTCYNNWEKMVVHGKLVKQEKRY